MGNTFRKKNLTWGQGKVDSIKSGTEKLGYPRFFLSFDSRRGEGRSQRPRRYESLWRSASTSCGPRALILSCEVSPGHIHPVESPKRKEVLKEIKMHRGLRLF